ncbi:MAG: DUF1893 domain-containing protein, partial [Clostridia bacterium]|nr:DUF1893 domain-containing protein [Clostridia bacterium]
DLLGEKQATCVIVLGDNVLLSHERGVKPLLKIIDEQIDVKGAFAADKVVGKAAAMLYVLLGIRKLYASVISELAIEALERYGVEVSYATRVPMIRNRTDTGFCPMEQATKNISEPNEALLAIRKRLSELEK